MPGTKTGAWKKQQEQSGNDQALQIKGSGIGCSARQDGQLHGVELLLAVVKDGLQILTVAPILCKVGVQKNGVRCVAVQHQPGSEGWPVDGFAVLHRDAGGFHREGDRIPGVRTDPAVFPGVQVPGLFGAGSARKPCRRGLTSRMVSRRAFS